MTHRKARLGDVLDDHCSRCRLLMNHSVVGIVEGEVRKVRCKTCLFEHPFRQGRSGRTHDKQHRDRQKMFDQVLKGKSSSRSAAEASPRTPVSGRRVRIARPEAPHEHHHRSRKPDPPAATLPPAPDGKRKVAPWRRAWEEMQKKNRG